MTDVHEREQCAIAAEHVDMLQIPAFLCRQTDLVIAAAQTGKIINIKKGQFLAPWDMKNLVMKSVDSGNPNVCLTERGTCFGYNTLVTDMRAFPQMAKDTGCPIIFDATHSVQHGPRLPSAWPPSLWKRTKIRTKRSRMAPTQLL